MTRPLRILLIADHAAGAQTLQMLAGSPHEIVAVMTRGTGALGLSATVAGVATRLGCQVWPARRAIEAGFPEAVRHEEIDLLLNVQGPYVLPPEVVAAPRIGSFNLHLGPLPRYPGLNAPSWAIYHGEHAHAATVHWMDAGIDTGPIAYEVALDIDEDDTGLTLTAKCVRAGLPLVHDLLRAAVRGDVPRRPQVNGARRYHGREIPQGGQLAWTDSAERIVDFIRACDYLPFPSPWGHPRATIGGRDILVLKAERTGEPTDAPPGLVGRRLGSEVLVAGGDEWVRLRRVELGRFSRPAGEVLLPGDRFAVPSTAKERTLKVLR